MIQLTRRERRLGIGVIAVVALWSIYALGIGPMRDRIQRLDRILPEKQNELREIQAKRAEYQALSRDFEVVKERMAQQSPDFELMPFLESLTERHNLSVVTMQQQDVPGTEPGHSETVVEIGFEGIALRQLIGFLRAIENSPVMTQVGSLHIRKRAQGELRLDATVQIYSPGPTSEAVAADLSLQ